MAPEQQQNQPDKYMDAVSALYKEKLEELKNDPGKFNEQSLQKEFKARLDKVAGKATLPADQLAKYLEAMKKIDQNITRLKDQIDVIKIETSLKANDLTQKDADRKNPWVYEVLANDFEKLNRIIARPKPETMNTGDYLREGVHTARVRDQLASELKTYLGNLVQKNYKTIMDADGRRTAGTFRLTDYVEMESAMFDLDMLIKDKDKYLGGHGYDTKDIDPMFVQAGKKIETTTKRLPLFLESLNDEERLAILNRDRTDRNAREKGGRANRQERDLASREVNLLQAQQDAKRNATTAMMVSMGQENKVVDIETYKSAERRYAEGERLLRREPDNAYRRFMEARDLYSVYIAEQNIASRKRDLQKIGVARGAYAKADQLNQQAGELYAEGNVLAANERFAQALKAYDSVYVANKDKTPVRSNPINDLPAGETRVARR
jgi:hypothetical protein